MLKRQSERAQRIPPAEWLVPENIEVGPFEIDELIRQEMMNGSRNRQLIWSNIEYAVAFGRRSLEVAIRSAISAVPVNYRAAIDDWDRVDSAAKQANAALHDLLCALTRSKASPDLDELARWIERSAVVPFNARRPSTRVVRSRRAASSLVNAIEFTEKLAKAAQAQREDVGSKHRHEGDPAFRAFVDIVAEAWVCLTGRSPTASITGGALQTFLAAAWHDVGGSIPASSDAPSLFISGARAARLRFPPNVVAGMVANPRLPSWVGGYLLVHPGT